MGENVSLNLFISYSHEDENFIKEFIKHLSPLKTNKLVKEWYDRKIIAGQDFQDTIDNNLDKADIICLCISANFLSSSACMREKRKAIKLKKKQGITIIPIILTACGWLDDRDLSTPLALPTDGKHISSFQDHNDGWKIVYDGLKPAIEQIIKIKNLKISDEFTAFLNNTELLSFAHSKKTEVFLDDIFVYPELIKYDELKEYEKKVSSLILFEEFEEYSKILIAGEYQSGKTTLCKRFFKELRKKNYVPIYVSDNNYQYMGLIENKITNAFKEQYKNLTLCEIEKDRIVPIIDNFHYAAKKDKYLQELSNYCHQILIVDDIFNLNFKDESLTKSFNQYKIMQYSPSLRNDLIEKWVFLNDNTTSSNQNGKYKDIDTITENVNSTLGKVINSGIMPAYPFFILSVISTYETFEKPLDQEITSQGYCYQALLYMYLRKQGVKNDEIDTYINFLSLLANHFFQEKKQELSKDEFNLFMQGYLNKYNLPIKKDTLLSNLQKTKILLLNSCNNYYFYYPYLYYFFVAKYLAEHFDDSKEIIKQIISNLHKDENAYITIFMSHHSKNSYILEEIVRNSSILFEKYSPAILSKNELAFFDEKIDSIIKAVLPPKISSPEVERNKRLKQQDLIEETQEKENKKVSNIKDDSADNKLAIDLRRSIKTVEVMGIIIKNRSGSLEKDKLEKIFKDAMNVHLRILSSFFEVIKNENSQNEIVDYISTRLNAIIEEKGKKPKEEQLKKYSKEIFWNMNFSIVYGLINKIIHSIGSDKLLSITETVCDEVNTPSSFLVKHGIYMWYNKNLQIENIANKIKEKEFSETAKRIIKFLIVNHCSLHNIDYKDKQKIENKLNIPQMYIMKKE